MIRNWGKSLIIGLILVALAYTASVYWLLHGEAAEVAKLAVLEKFDADSVPHTDRSVWIRWWLPWKLTNRADWGYASFVICSANSVEESRCYQMTLQKKHGRWMVTALHDK